MSNNTLPENPLGAHALGKIILASIPPTASPKIKTPVEALALAAHACMIATGFRLIGLSEDHNLSEPSDANDPKPLPSEWNAHSTYTFKYAHSQSAMKFLLTAQKLGPQLNFSALALGHDKVHVFDIKTGDYTSEGNLPADKLSLTTTNDDSTRKLGDIFITEGRLSDFAKRVRTSIIQKLIPSTDKEGYESSSQTTSSSTSTSRPPPQIVPGRGPENPTFDPLREDRDPPARPFPFDDPLARPRQPGRPLPEPIPGFDDEYETLRPARGFPGAGAGGGFPRIGERDLYPQGLGPHDPIRGGIGPSFGGGGMMGGGGMHPTFDDPLFAGQGQGGRGGESRGPPGSRYDPVGPGMGGMHPRGSGMGGRPPNPFGGYGDGDFI